MKTKTYEVERTVVITLGKSHKRTKRLGSGGRREPEAVVETGKTSRNDLFRSK